MLVFKKPLGTYFLKNRGSSKGTFPRVVVDLATPSQVLEICSNVPRTCILTRSQAIQIHTKGQEALVKDAPNFG